MADLIQIPATSDFPSQKFTTTIDGTVYAIKIRWNGRFERWVADIMTDGEDPILVGIPLHINTDLMGRFRDLRLPQGLMILFNSVADGIEATRQNLGSDTKFLFRAFD